MTAPADIARQAPREDLRPGRLDPKETSAGTGVHAPDFGRLRRNRGVRGVAGPPGARRRRWPRARRPDRRERKARQPLDVELARADPLPPRLAAQVGALGFDVEQVREDTQHVERAQAMRVVAGLFARHHGRLGTTSGTDRADRLAACGTLWAARKLDAPGGGTLGAEHKVCRDRACPRCMAARQSQESKFLHRFARHRLEHGSALLFPTLTQIKLPLRWEDCGDALDRLERVKRELMNTHGAFGAGLRRYFAGGVFFVEVTWSYKGKLRRDGTRVAESGWHAHLHGVFELSAIPNDLPVEPEHAHATWREMAVDYLVRHWLALNPECDAAAQKVLDVDADSVGQVCKYPLKPFEIENIERQREAIEALVDKRTQNAWGTWRGWKRKAKRLLLEDDVCAGTPKRARTEFARQTLAEAIERSTKGESIWWMDREGKEVLHAVKASTLISKLRLAPSTFSAQAAAASDVAHARSIEQSLDRPRGPP